MADTLVFLVVLGANALQLAVSLLGSLSGEAPGRVRLFAALLALLYLACTGLLLAGRRRRLPAAAAVLLRLACLALPLAWLAGGVEHGRLAGDALAAAAFAGVLAMASWAVFRYRQARL